MNNQTPSVAPVIRKRRSSQPYCFPLSKSNRRMFLLVRRMAEGALFVVRNAVSLSYYAKLALDAVELLARSHAHLLSLLLGLLSHMSQS